LGSSLNLDAGREDLVSCHNSEGLSGFNKEVLG
jgi:hypothetical protein